MPPFATKLYKHNVQYNSTDSFFILANYISTLYEDSKGLIWIASSNGVNVSELGEWLEEVMTNKI